VNRNSSTTHCVSCSVPQGLVLGPLEFILYTEDVSLVFEQFNIKHHLFADDQQAYASSPLQGVNDVHDRIHDCTTDISNWCVSSATAQQGQNGAHVVWQAFPPRSTRRHGADSIRRYLCHQTVTSGTRSWCSSRSRTWHDTTFRKSDAILLLSVAKTVICVVQAARSLSLSWSTRSSC